ncbi:MAG: family 43 glycosylhydrolase, partial [Microbacterium gubbeenense]
MRVAVTSAPARSRLRAGLAVTAAAAVAWVLAVAPASPAAADVPEPDRTIVSPGNPIIADGSLYTADAAPLVVDDTLYIHAGHDEAAPDEAGFNMRDYSVLATNDPASGSWDLYSENLAPGDVFDWSTGNAAYAGQVVTGADGRYYWYAPVEWDNAEVPNAMAIGVAVSDSPVGPWTDAIGDPLLTWYDVFGESATGQEVIDPHVFTDVDGRVYLYWGSWNVARAVELDPNMIELTGDIRELAGLDSFYEAPWVFERNGTYFMAYDWKQPGSECTPSNYQACIGYATADDPLGPWEYQGLILEGTSSTTVHPSIIEFDDAWYITYHTKDAADGGHFRRSVAIDEVEWDGDRILPVTQTWADDPAFRLTENVAPEAEATASYTEQPPMRLGAVNDGSRSETALLPPDQWGNYRGTDSTVASDWLAYQWETPVRVDGAGIEFHRDSNWIRSPESWALEYVDAAGDWHPVTGASYPTATDEWHEIAFDAVTTSALRATFHGQAGGAYVHSVSVSEWEVYAAAAEELPHPETWTSVGAQPELPEAVRMPFAGEGDLWVPVNWREIAARDLAEPGAITVSGRALGQQAGEITATVHVGGDAPGMPADELPPTVSIAAVTPETEGWFSSDVPLRVTAQDDTDYRLTIETRPGEGAWTATDDASFAELVVSDEGETTLAARAIDAAGNVSEETTRTIRIDATPPDLDAQLTDARTVTVDAADALSGLARIEYRFGADDSWTAAQPGDTIAPPDELPHDLAIRAIDVAGNTAQSIVQIPLGDAELTGELAQYATPSASYTSAWEDVAGLNDGSGGLFDDDASAYGASWGTWDRAGEQWAQLDWAFDATIDEIGVWWYRDSPDSAQGGLIPPRDWVLEYLDGEEWVEVELTGDSAYGRTSDGYDRVAFAPVTTGALRITAQSWGDAAGQGSIGIREWQV